MPEQDWIGLRLDGLLAIASQIFPANIPGTGRHDEWLIAGHGLMARATRSLHALQALKPGAFVADAWTVSRSLFEHVTRFAWLAADPSGRMPLWIKWDRQERIKVDNDLAEVRDTRRLPAEIRLRFERERDAIPGSLPGLKDLAIAADMYWSRVLPEHANDRTRYGLTGVYRVLYRHSSAISHGTAYGLSTFVRQAAPGLLLIGDEQIEAGHSPFSYSAIVYAMGLLIHAHAFDVEGMREALDAVFAAAPDPRQLPA